MALFKVNTGLREQEVVNLRWNWETPVPELDTSVFVIPRSFVKNGLDRYVVLNRVAKSVIDGCRCADRGLEKACAPQSPKIPQLSSWQLIERSREGKSFCIGEALNELHKRLRHDSNGLRLAATPSEFGLRSAEYAHCVVNLLLVA